MTAPIDPAVFKGQLASQMWRLHNLYWIIDKDGRQVQFKPNENQYRYLQKHSGKDIILKARQLGFTTLISIIGLDEAIFIPNWAVALIAHTQDDAAEIFQTKVKFPYQELPETIKNMVTADNSRERLYRFSNNSSMRVTSSARSGTVQRLHISEFGKICSMYPKKAQEIVTGSFPAAERGDITIESTAEGQDGYFYHYCTDAMEGKGEFQFHFHAWWQNPQYVWTGPHPRATPADEQYFLRLLKDEKIELTDVQKA